MACYNCTQNDTCPLKIPNHDIPCQYYKHDKVKVEKRRQEYFEVMELWIGVEIYGLILEGVKVFRSGEEARHWFAGLMQTEAEVGDDIYDRIQAKEVDYMDVIHPDYEQSNIFRVEV